MTLCIDHKLELWKRGYGSAEAIAVAVPTAYFKRHCDICNGTWSVNQAISKAQLSQAHEEGKLTGQKGKV